VREGRPRGNDALHAVPLLPAELDPAAEELWSWFCFQRGATGAEWREETPARLRIAYFFDQLRERDPERWRAEFAAAFPAASPPGRVAIAERPREPWATAWHAHFAPEPVAGRFLVCPPWAVPQATGEGPYAGRIPLVIEPGQGFGTGKHATTALVLALLEDLAGGWMEAGAVPGWIVDVGTGSGCVPLALAVNVADLHVLAGDVSAEGLAVATENVKRFALEARVHLVSSDLLENLAGPFDVICANLPYIPEARLPELAVSKWEPRVALGGGADGLRFIEPFLQQAQAKLAFQGLVLAEIDASLQGIADQLERVHEERVARRAELQAGDDRASEAEADEEP